MAMDQMVDDTGTADAIDPVVYPQLASLAAPLARPEREIVGREHEIDILLASMDRPELCNAVLIAEPGSGKTALVQATMLADPDRRYLEVDPARMMAEAGSPEIMASLLKDLFDEAERYVLAEGRQLVMFIDEFHQIVQLSGAAVEAIKPILAASGARGIRIIAATTFDEFHKYISPNQPLVERLQRINLAPPDEAATVRILRGMAERYGVADQFPDDRLFQLIYADTERFQPASVQPRKSILVLDAMVGWHRHSGVRIDRALLSRVLEESVGVNVAMTVNGANIKTELDRRVIAQDLATSVLSRRLQLSVADLNNPRRPQASLLFAGSSGVGKTETAKQLARLMFGDDQRHLIRMDMTEFSEDASLQTFRSVLTQAVWNTPYAVVLLDEVEKASALVTRLLLQVLDDGRLSDDNGREVSFLNTYIVMTTNAGSEIFATIADYEASDTGSGENLADYDKLIRTSLTETTGENRFPPELLGRVDAIVPFQPLSPATQKKIVTGKVQALINTVLVKHGVRVRVSPRVIDYLIEDKGDTDSNAGGARAAVARLTSDVTTEIAVHLNQHPADRDIRVDVAGELVSDNKTLRTSDAHIVVAPTASR